MAKIFQHRAVRIFRVIFRWCRIIVLFAIFLALVCVAYFHLIGLPEFVKQPVLARMRDHGFDIEFTEMRLGWDQKILIENAAFRSARQPLGPKLTTARTEVAINFRSLVEKQFKLDSLLVDRAQLVMPLVQSNRFASLDDVQLKLKFLPNDFLQLENFDATFRGAKFHLTGTLTNFSAARDWPFFHAQAKTNQDFQAKLERLVANWDKFHFSNSPELNLSINGDARDLDSLKADLEIALADARSPWASGKKIQIRISGKKFFNPGDEKFLRVHVMADECASRWASGKQINLNARLSRDAAVTNLFHSDLTLAARNFFAGWTNSVKTNWIRAEQIESKGAMTFSSTNWSGTKAGGSFDVAHADSSWGSMAQAHATWSGQFNSPVAEDPNLGGWLNLMPFQISVRAEGRDIKSPKLELATVDFFANWFGGELSLEKLHAELYGGHLAADVKLNVATREVQAKAESNFDPHKIAPLLTPAGQHWISQYDWEKPPRVEGELRATLPAWTNRQPDWRGEVLPSLRINGKFAVENGAFRGVPAKSASSQFSYTNRIWRLPRLHATRDDGEIFLEYNGSELTHDYYFKVESRIDPKVIRPLLESEQQQRVLDEMQFQQIPEIHGEVWGRWRERERIGASGRIAATNVVFRGERVDTVNAALSYTNLLLQISGAKVFRDGRELSAPEVDVDFASKKISLTNGFSTMDPMVVAKVVGPKVVQSLAPFHFDTPPTVRGAGSFLMHDPAGTDIHLTVQGENFSWTNLHADKISGQLNWIGRSIRVTNVLAQLYGKGQGKGWGQFDYLPERGTDFRFDFSAVDISLPLAAKSFSGKTNRLEGMLDGQLTITGGNTRNRKTWQGYGRANVHDAVLWEIPIFGILSPVLNAIAPGAGNSRAHNAQANFMITNGLAYTGDLEIHAMGYRLFYRGGVGLEEQMVDARVEAELLRDTWVVGRVLSLALMPLSKLFEYHITGPLQAPKMEPTYIPKFLMMTLRPFHTLKTLATPEQEPAPLIAPQQKSK